MRKAWIPFEELEFEQEANGERVVIGDGTFGRVYVAWYNSQRVRARPSYTRGKPTGRLENLQDSSRLIGSGTAPQAAGATIVRVSDW